MLDEPLRIGKRALEHGNLLVADATAHEVGHIDLREALALTALTALHARERGGRSDLPICLSNEGHGSKGLNRVRR